MILLLDCKLTIVSCEDTAVFVLHNGMTSMSHRLIGIPVYFEIDWTGCDVSQTQTKLDRNIRCCRYGIAHKQSEIRVPRKIHNLCKLPHGLSSVLHVFLNFCATLNGPPRPKQCDGVYNPSRFASGILLSTGFLFTKKWIIGIPFCPAAIKRLGVRFIQRRGALKTLNQIRI